MNTEFTEIAKIGSWLISSDESHMGVAPKKIVLFRAGWGSLLDPEKTKFFIDEKSFDLIYAKFKAHGVDLAWDYEHQTLTGKEAPAAAWIKNLHWESSVGIVADVEWTGKGADYVSKKEYRYFSPVFYVRKGDSRVTEIHSVALTNTPKTDNLDPIIASLRPTGSERNRNMKEYAKRIAAAMEMEPDADDEKGDKLVDKVKACYESSKAAKKASLDAEEDAKKTKKAAKDIRVGLGLSEDADQGLVMAKVLAFQSGGDKDARLAALEDRLATKEAEGFVADALKAGKISPAGMEWAFKCAKNTPGDFKAFLANAPTVVPVDPIPAGPSFPAGGPGPGPESLAMKVAKLFDNTPDDLKKFSPEFKG